MTLRLLRRPAAGLFVRSLLLGVAFALVVTASGTAHATTAYRYWAYYLSSNGGWQYSQRGPASEHPQDGDVQGWRFAVQADRAGGLPPRAEPGFAALCASTTAVAGKIRVGIVLDFGVATDAPAGERPPAGVVTGCVRVAPGANGVDVLDAAVGAGEVRIGAGLICGIDGYPKTECAAAVQAPTPSASPARSTPTPTPTPGPKSPQTPTAAPSTPARSTPARSASAPSTPTPSASGAAAVAPASAQQPAATSPAAASAPTTLRALHTAASHHTFPTGAVVGGLLVLGLAVAALLRGTPRRR